MKRVVALLLISMAVGSGCAARPGTITVQQTYTRCPRPAAPVLPSLDPEQHLCSPDNLGRLMEIVDQQCWMIGQQGAALDCYEAQAKGGR